MSSSNYWIRDYLPLDWETLGAGLGLTHPGSQAQGHLSMNA